MYSTILDMNSPLIVAIVTAIIGPLVVYWVKRRHSDDPDGETRQQHQAPPTPEPKSDTEALSEERTPKVDVEPLFSGLDPDVFGRKPQLRKLDEAWDDDEINIVSIVAAGGVGKSALINQWLWSLGEKYRGASRVYGWSFNVEHTVNSFVEDALEFFDDPNPKAGDSSNKGERLAELIDKHKTLLILDGLESLQYPTGHTREGYFNELRGRSVIRLLRRLVGHNQGLCIISTRLALADLRQSEGEGKPCRIIKLKNLSPQAGAQLLKSKDVWGSQEDLEKAAKDFAGHCLALSLLGTYVYQRYDGDIRKRAQEENLLDDPEKSERGIHAQRVMASYEEWFQGKSELAVLRLLGLFDYPVEEDLFLEFLVSPPIPSFVNIVKSPRFTDWPTALLAFLGSASIRGLWNIAKWPISTDWPTVINNLSSAELISKMSKRGAPQEPAELRLAHPLILEYFGGQLRRSNKVWRDSHYQLYELYINKARKQPTTIAGMNASLRAVIHGCNAGRHEAALHHVYLPLVMGGEDEAYAENELEVPASALLSVQSHFFEEGDWSRPARQLSDSDKLLVLRDAGRYLTEVKGYAASEVGVCYKTAVTLSEKFISKTPSNFFEASLGLCRFHRVRGELETSCNLANKLLDIFSKLDDATLDPIVSSAIHRALATNFYYTGDFVASVEHAEEGIVNYSDEKQALKSARFDVNEPSLCCLAYKALGQWILGCPEKALSNSRDAVRKAQELGHAHTKAIILLVDAMVNNFCRDPDATRRSAETLVDHCEKQGFSLWLISGHIMRAWSLGDTKGIRQNISRWEDTEARLYMPYWWALLAETCLRNGELEDGIESACKGLDCSRDTGEHWWDAELYRLKGELMLVQSQALLEAEKLFNTALGKAKSQSAKSLQLRAALSLAHVPRQNGNGDAFRALKEIHREFNEGFETEDLKDAKLLLDNLQ